MTEKTGQLQLQPTNEDTVTCLFFSSSLNSDISSWERLSKDINKTIETLTEGYIWHRDEFKAYLPIVDNKDNGIPNHLTSTTCFGDNIEDEWFIVYLVLEITKQYKDLIIQIKDNDGDFLLIEAADYLPSWANPENTENRVFIYNNHLHIIPPHVANLETTLGLQEAIRLLLNATKDTLVSPEIEYSILSRVSNYPEKIKENIHRAIVNLPVDIAALINLKPALIAPIVCAYCDCDVIDAKACKKTVLSNSVTVEVKFTKCLYAMLRHAKPIKGYKHLDKIENDKRNSLGYKISCGYQIIMASTTDIFSSKQYNTFIHSLKENGYFKNNIEGSKSYQELLDKAKDFFSAIECPTNYNVSHKIFEVMSSEEFMKKKELLELNNTTGSDLSEDNEDWLNIHPDQLNELLNTRYGKKAKFKNMDVISPETIATELSSFLKKTSDFEGVEINEIDETENNNIEFYEDEFNSCLEKFLNLLSSKGDEGMSESRDSLDSDMSDVDENLSQFEDNEDDEELDRELKSKLNNDIKDNLHDSNSILSNIIQSMKEENASSGPSSNLLKAVGLNKTDFLDSDDDDY